MKQSDLKPGLRVHRGDPTRAGTIRRVLGIKRAGGGLHARVDWDSGGSSVVRADLLTQLPEMG